MTSLTVLVPAAGLKRSVNLRNDQEAHLEKKSSCWMLGSRKSVSLRVCEGSMRFGIYEFMSGIFKNIIWIPYLVLQCPSEHVGVSTTQGYTIHLVVYW